MQVRIQGDGIAAACCARLLTQGKLSVEWSWTDRPRVPVILLTGAALTLLGDVFGPLPRLAGAHRIQRRVVAWGEGAEPVAVDHAAVVVSEERMLASVKFPPMETVGSSSSDWFVLTSPPMPAECRQHSFGVRRATVTRVDLRDEADADACFTESVREGWLFLIPESVKSACLLAVGSSPEMLLSTSRLIGPRIVSPGELVGSFPTHPRILWPLCGSGWLACGSAAMAFDPLCGDGTGQAVREAILASAVLRSLQAGSDLGPLLSHYRGRLAAGMARHLGLCSEYYRTGGSGLWWSTALQAVHQGVQWCGSKLEGKEGLQYRMSGFELQPVA